MSEPFNIHDWQDKQRFLSEQKDEVSKDAQLIADHPLLDKINTKDEWVDIMNALMKHASTIPAVSDSIKKTTLLTMVKTIGKEEPEDLEELNMTGTGVSFNAGSGEGYATPNAFGDNKKKKMKAYKSIGYKKI